MQERLPEILNLQSKFQSQKFYTINPIVPSDEEWDLRARKYKVSIEGDTEEAVGKRQRLERIFTQHAIFNRDDVIADLGCGPGVLLAHMMKFEAGHIYEVDISNTMLQRAIKKAGELSIPSSKVEFIQANADATGLPDNSCNVVMVFNSFAHLEVNGLLEESARILPENGILAFVQSMSRETLNKWRQDDCLPYKDEMSQLLLHHRFDMLEYIDADYFLVKARLRPQE